MPARIDLHTHSQYSDGLLSPAALVELAARREVRLLALTDHDTIAGCAAAASACEQHGICFVPGIELSCDWQQREIHVVGLGLDVENAALQAHCAAVRERRRERMLAMARKLTRAGLPGETLAQAALTAASPTRTHLARAMCRHGIARDMQQAFDRWLKRGRPAHVAAHWPALEAAVRCIIGAGGTAVLAHPHRYPLSHGQLRQLTADFAAAGGGGIEVSLAGMAPKDADRAVALARRHGLAGSIGSDFHEPDLPWRPLGRFDKLPDSVTPIAARFEPEAIEQARSTSRDQTADERSGR
ncbi:MAG: PHP domain-containing protein [Steroidobacteraceae bacterium]